MTEDVQLQTIDGSHVAVVKVELIDNKARPLVVVSVINGKTRYFLQALGKTRSKLATYKECTGQHV